MGTRITEGLVGYPGFFYLKEKKMGITLSTKGLQDVLSKCIYAPHPDVNVGKIYCTAPGRENDTDDSCVLISSSCRIDVTGDVYLGKWVYIANRVQIFTHIHKLKGIKPLLLVEEDGEIDPKEFTIPVPKVIGDDVWLFESTILPKCTGIARGVIIGAGSIVTDVINEEYSIWAGNPARKVGMR